MLRGRSPRAEAQRELAEAVSAFREAASLRPNWPDPHLGLARTFIYGMEDIDRGADAMNQAEKLGYRHYATGPYGTNAEPYDGRPATVGNGTHFGFVAGLSRTEAGRAADRWLERLGLADKAGAYPRDLSVGERQRVALAELLFAGPHRHVSAEQLHAEANQASVNVSLATIYNTLHQFTEVGLLLNVAPKKSANFMAHLGITQAEWHAKTCPPDEVTPAAQAARSGSRISDDSVSSTHRYRACAPVSSRIARTWSRNSSSWRSMAEMFTAILVSGRPASRHVRIWRHASRRTQRPMGTMSPVSSASGMKLPGATRPSSPRRHLISASSEVTAPVLRFARGW